MKLTVQELDTIAQFTKWTTSTFGGPFVSGDSPVFDPTPHLDAQGDLTINRGRFQLIIRDVSDGVAKYHLHSVIEGGRIEVVTGENLEPILLAGLFWSIRQNFVDNY